MVKNKNVVDIFDKLSVTDQMRLLNQKSNREVEVVLKSSKKLINKIQTHLNNKQNT